MRKIPEQDNTFVPRRGSRRSKRGPLKARGSTLGRLIGKTTSTKSIYEVSFYPSIFVAPPKQTRNQPHRDFLNKNLEELILGLGWRGICYETLWVNLPRELSILDDLFYTEFPISYPAGKRYVTDICRVFQGRIEMEACRKSHRAAIIDMSRENNYSKKSTSIEVLLEHHCDCFYDGERNREGAFYVYAWRSGRNPGKKKFIPKRKRKKSGDPRNGEQP